MSLNTIYNFLIKCKRNIISFETLLSDKKLDAIKEINKVYQEYKQVNNLVDISDIEQTVLNNWDNCFTDAYDEIYIDSFNIGDISYVKSLYQKIF